jgi:hypothetical protein
MDHSSDITERIAELWKAPVNRPYAARTGLTLFEWIESTDCEHCERARNRLSHLWSTVPEGLKRELLRRLRASDDPNFYSAFTELWFADAIRQAGIDCQIAMPAIHQIGRSNPDLVLWPGTEHLTMAECRLKMSYLDSSSELAVRQVLWCNVFRNLHNKQIRLGVIELRMGRQTPSARVLARRLDDLARIGLKDESISAPVHNLGLQEIDDPETGFFLRFHLFIHSGAHAENVIAFESVGDARLCRGEQILETLLKSKSRQHRTLDANMVLCIAWQLQYEHPIDEAALREVVARQRHLLGKRKIEAVIWVSSLYPWSDTLPEPLLIYWDGTNRRFLDQWRGPTVDVG